MRKWTQHPAWFIFWTAWCAFWAVEAATAAMFALSDNDTAPAVAMMAVTVMLTVLLVINFRNATKAMARRRR